MAEAKRAHGLPFPGRKTGDTLKFRDIRKGTGAQPTHPMSADHFSKVGDWGLYTNDRFGVCGPTGAANQAKLVTKYLLSQEWSPTLNDVYDLYRRSGNPNFDPDTGEGDNGVILQDMLNAMLKGGLGGKKPLAFAEINVEDDEELFAGVAIFGSLLFGVDLKKAQDQQTNDGLWDYKPRSPEWGGHCVMGGRYIDPNGTKNDRTGVVTWATVVDFTDQFRQHQLQEAWVVIWPENVGTTQFQQTMSLSNLAEAYADLTGQTLPAVPTPTPPTSTYEAADLAADIRSLLTTKGL